MESMSPQRPATQQAAALRDRILSSRELLEMYLDRIVQLNPPMRWAASTEAVGLCGPGEAKDFLTGGLR